MTNCARIEQLYAILVVHKQFWSLKGSKLVLTSSKLGLLLDFVPQLDFAVEHILICVILLLGCLEDSY